MHLLERLVEQILQILICTPEAPDGLDSALGTAPQRSERIRLAGGAASQPAHE